MYQVELQQWRKKVETSIMMTCRAEEARAAAVDPRARFIVDRIKEYVLRGSSKRLRAFLVLLGYTSIRSRPPVGLVHVAAALEFLHAYLLMHDDVIDHDDVRRGGPTMHIQFSRKLSSAHMGEALAILAGNITRYLAQCSLAKAKLSLADQSAAVALVGTMDVLTNYGEALDVWLGSEQHSRLADIEKVYLYKTAKYSVEGPLLLGANIAGANSGQRKILSRFALLAGVAYQLQDDLLGIFGEAKQIGKPVGSDIREGKRTTLYLYTLRLANTADRKRFQEVYGREKVSHRQIAEIRRICTESGARAKIEKEIHRLCEKAADVIGEGTALRFTARQALLELNQDLARRSS